MQIPRPSAVDIDIGTQNPQCYQWWKLRIVIASGAHIPKLASLTLSNTKTNKGKHQNQNKGKTNDITFVPPN